MSRLTCSFFIYYYLYYSYINSIYYSYTIANSSSNITPSKKSIYSPLFWRGAGGEAIPSFSPFSPSYPPWLPLLYIVP